MLTKQDAQGQKRRGRKSTASEDNIYYILRVTNGLSLQELSRYTGVHANSLCHLEHGGEVKFRVIKAVSEFYGVSADDLVRNNVAGVFGERISEYAALSRNRQSLNIHRSCVANGNRGEDIAAEIERELLSGTGYQDRVSTRPAKNRRNGYDVISATPEGKPKYIEVKATSSKDPNEPFFMSAAEYHKMIHFLTHGDVYELYRIYDLDLAAGTYRYVTYSAEEILTLFKPVPSVYSMEKKEGILS